MDERIHALLHTWYSIDVVEDAQDARFCHVKIVWTDGNFSWPYRFRPAQFADEYVNMEMLAFALAMHLRRLPSA